MEYIYGCLMAALPPGRAFFEEHLRASRAAREAFASRSAQMSPTPLPEPPPAALCPRCGNCTRALSCEGCGSDMVEALALWRGTGITPEGLAVVSCTSGDQVSSRAQAVNDSTAETLRADIGSPAIVRTAALFSCLAGCHRPACAPFTYRRAFSRCYIGWTRMRQLLVKRARRANAICYRQPTIMSLPCGPDFCWRLWGS